MAEQRAPQVASASAQDAVDGGTSNTESICNRRGTKLVIVAELAERFSVDCALRANTYPPAIASARKGGLLSRNPLHYVTKHLQQGIEGDHFRAKKNMPRIGGFQSFNTAR